MRTIANARKDPSDGKTKYQHCPATYLVAREPNDPTPLRNTSEFSAYSPDHYAGYFHTDHLIPSVFFQKDRDPKTLKNYDDLSFRYIFDGSLDPEGHAELMAGTPAKWYDVRNNMDRLPDFVDPEHTTVLDHQTRGRLTRWLEERIQGRF